jgi:hypothetical protein
MAKGDEPLRSFGDLMQFFKKAQPEPVVKPKVVETKNSEGKNADADTAPKASENQSPASEPSAAPEMKSETPSSPASGADGENPAT